MRLVRYWDTLSREVVLELVCSVWPWSFGGVVRNLYETDIHDLHLRSQRHLRFHPLCAQVIAPGQLILFIKSFPSLAPEWLQYTTSLQRDHPKNTAAAGARVASSSPSGHRLKT